MSLSYLESGFCHNNLFVTCLLYILHLYLILDCVCKYSCNTRAKNSTSVTFHEQKMVTMFIFCIFNDFPMYAQLCQLCGVSFCNIHSRTLFEDELFFCIIFVCLCRRQLYTCGDTPVILCHSWIVTRFRFYFFFSMFGFCRAFVNSEVLGEQCNFHTVERPKNV